MNGQSLTTTSRLSPGVIKEYRAKWKPHRMIIDPANAQMVIELQNRHQLPLEKADKLGKRAHIEMLNSALRQRYALLPRTVSDTRPDGDS